MAHVLARRTARAHVRSLSAALALVVFGGATLSACGGSDEATSATTVAAASASAESEEDGDAEGAKASTSDDPFCQQVAAASEKFGLNSAAATGINAALSQLPEAAKLLEEASADAPAEIKPDLEVLSATLAEVAPLLTQVAELSVAAQTDTAKAGELAALSGELTQKMTAISDPKFTAAIENLNVYAKEHCGIEFS